MMFMQMMTENSVCAFLKKQNYEAEQPRSTKGNQRLILHLDLSNLIRNE